MKTLLLKNGTLVLPNKIIQRDLLIKGEKIYKIAPKINDTADQLIDCQGKHIFPGAIDVHVHFRTPGDEQKEDWITGSRSAAKGGVTTVLDMPNTSPPTTTEAILDEKREIVKQTSIINYGFNFGATYNNLNEIKKVFGKKGVPAVKVYMGASTGSLLMDRLDVLEDILKAGVMVLVHAECNCMLEDNKKRYIDEHDVSIHSKIREPEVAFKAMKDAVDLATKTGGRLHVCHMSTRLEVEYLRKIRAEMPEKTKNISCEVCPHHLYFDTSAYSTMGTYVQMNPSLHETEDVTALWQGISDGTVDMIATDHAPHLRSEKEQEYGKAPSGVPGVETVVPFLLNAANEKRINISDIARLMGSAPAERFRLKNKGILEEGMDADIFIADLNKEKIILNQEQETKCGWSPFHNVLFKGLPETTIVQGNIVYNEGDFDMNFQGKEVQIKN